MAQTIETEQRNGLTIRIVYDEHGGDPREWDQLGVMVADHRRYSLGDRKPTDGELTALEYGGLAALERHVRRQYGATVLIPIGLLDHSGLHVYADGGAHFTDSAGWDSGTVGYIFDTAETRAMTGAPIDDIERQLRAEIEEYDQFLRGDVYGYIVEDENSGETVDSCWGFLGDIDYCREQAREAADAQTDHAALAAGVAAGVAAGD